MRFLFLIHGDSEAEAAMTHDERRGIVGEHIVYASVLRQRGAYTLGGHSTPDGQGPSISCRSGR